MNYKGKFNCLTEKSEINSLITYFSAIPTSSKITILRKIQFGKDVHALVDDANKSL